MRPTGPAAGFMRRHGRWLVAILFLGLVAFQTGRVLRVEREITGGEISLPLDDSFIYLQYARAAAEGHPFVYTPGNGPTTGATSLLYPFLLVPPHLLHLGPDAGIAWALALGAAALVLSGLLMLQLGSQLGGPVGAVLAVGLFYLVPHTLWGYLSGMEIALYATVLLATLHAYLKERAGGRFPRTRWWLFALAASRPEGAALAVVFGGAMLLARSRASREPGGPRLLSPVVLLPFVAAAVPFLVCWIVTGSIQSTGAMAKSILSDPHPDTRAQLIRQSPLVWLRIARCYLSLLPSDPQDVLPHYMAAGGVGAALFALLCFLPRRRPWVDGRILLALVPAGIVVNSIPYFWWVHLERYQQGLFPVVLLAFAAGYGRLAWIAWTRLPRWAGAAVALVAVGAPVLLYAPSLLLDQERIVRFYGHNCENILHQQVRVGRWVNATLPKDTIVAMNDAGAIAYYGHRRTLDLVGLTTAGFARVYRSGTGCLWERLRRLPRADRPDYFAIYPGWFPNFAQSGLLSPVVFRARLALNTICGGVEEDVFPAVWSRVADADRPVAAAPDTAGLRLVDSLDLAWLPDEARHEWRVEPLLRDILRSYSYATPRTGPIADAGRIVHGAERFRARVVPGKDLLLIMRTDAWFPSRLRVSVDGRPAGIWSIAKSESVWVEPEFRVPGALLTRNRPEFRIERVGYDPAAFRIGGGKEAETPYENRPNYAPFHYWLYQ